MHASPSLRPKAAAQYLSISTQTLWRWVKERDDFPKPIRLGPRTTIFEISKLDEFRSGCASKVAA